MAQNKYLATLFLRYEPTTEPMLKHVQHEYRDVAVYKDRDCTMACGRFRPGTKRPNKGMDKMQYNGGWLCNIEWVQDVFEPEFDKKQLVAV